MTKRNMGFIEGEVENWLMNWRTQRLSFVRALKRMKNKDVKCLSLWQAALNAMEASNILEGKSEKMRNEEWLSI